MVAMGAHLHMDIRPRSHPCGQSAWRLAETCKGPVQQKAPMTSAFQQEKEDATGEEFLFGPTSTKAILRNPRPGVPRGLHAARNPSTTIPFRPRYWIVGLKGPPE
jgi:hypothetical protein